MINSTNEKKKDLAVKVSIYNDDDENEEAVSLSRKFNRFLIHKKKRVLLNLPSMTLTIL